MSKELFKIPNHKDIIFIYEWVSMWLDVVAQGFDLSHQEAEEKTLDFNEFKVSLNYTVSSRWAKVTQ